MRTSNMAHFKVYHGLTLEGAGQSGNPLDVADGGVTTEKLADNSVSPDKIAANNNPANGDILKYDNGTFVWVEESEVETSQDTAAINTTYTDIATSLEDDDILAITLKATVGTNTFDRSIVERFGSIGSDKKILVGTATGNVVYLKKNGNKLQAKRDTSVTSASSKVWKLHGNYANIAGGGGSGDITGVTAGTGLTGGGGTGSVTLNVDTTKVPYVTSTPTTGQAVRKTEGGWEAYTPATQGGGGDITGVTAGTGLTGGGTSGDVTLSLAGKSYTAANQSKLNAIFEHASAWYQDANPDDTDNDGEMGFEDSQGNQIQTAGSWTRIVNVKIHKTGFRGSISNPLNPTSQALYDAFANLQVGGHLKLVTTQSGGRTACLRVTSVSHSSNVYTLGVTFVAANGAMLEGQGYDWQVYVLPFAETVGVEGIRGIQQAGNNKSVGTDSAGTVGFYDRPQKASVSDVITGTDNAKYSTPLDIKEAYGWLIDEAPVDYSDWDTKTSSISGSGNGIDGGTIASTGITVNDTTTATNATNTIYYRTSAWADTNKPSGLLAGIEVYSALSGTGTRYLIAYLSTGRNLYTWSGSAWVEHSYSEAGKEFTTHWRDAKTDWQAIDDENAHDTGLSYEWTFIRVTTDGLIEVVTPDYASANSGNDRFAMIRGTRYPAFNFADHGVVGVSDVVTAPNNTLALDDNELKRWPLSDMRAHVLGPTTRDLSIGSYEVVSGIPSTAGKVSISGLSGTQRTVNVTWSSEQEKAHVVSFIKYGTRIEIGTLKAEIPAVYLINVNTVANGGISFQIDNMSGTVPAANTTVAFIIKGDLVHWEDDDFYNATADNIYNQWAKTKLVAGTNITLTDSDTNNTVTIAASGGGGGTPGDGSVTTAKLADDAVTNAKVADNAIDTDQLADGAVDTSQLAAGAVENAKIADGTIEADKLEATNTPTDNQLPSYDSTTGGFTWVDQASGGGGGDVTGIDAGTLIRIDDGDTATPEVNIANMTDNYVIAGTGASTAAAAKPILDASQTNTFDTGNISELNISSPPSINSPHAIPLPSGYTGSTGSLSVANVAYLGGARAIKTDRTLVFLRLIGRFNEGQGIAIQLWKSTGEPSSTNPGAQVFQPAGGQNNILVDTGAKGSTNAQENVPANTYYWYKASADGRDFEGVQQQSSGEYTTGVTGVLGSGDIVTKYIADDAITAAKLADDSVETAAIKDANVTHAKLATDAVENDNIKDGTIEADKLEATNTPADNQIPSYDSSSGGFTWVDQSSGGGGGGDVTGIDAGTGITVDDADTATPEVNVDPTKVPYVGTAPSTGQALRKTSTGWEAFTPAPGKRFIAKFDNLPDENANPGEITLLTDGANGHIYTFTGHELAGDYRTWTNTLRFDDIPTTKGQLRMGPAVSGIRFQIWKSGTNTLKACRAGAVQSSNWFVVFKDN